MLCCYMLGWLQPRLQIAGITLAAAWCRPTGGWLGPCFVAFCSFGQRFGPTNLVLKGVRLVCTASRSKSREQSFQGRDLSRRRHLPCQASEHQPYDQGCEQDSGRGASAALPLAASTGCLLRSWNLAVQEAWPIPARGVRVGCKASHQIPILSRSCRFSNLKPIIPVRRLFRRR